MTGSISGFSFMIIGLPTVSSQYPPIWSRLSRISIVTASMLADCENSRMTIEIFSLETELTVSMLLIVAIACSTGLVTTVSTSSGLAPAYVV